MNTLLDIFNGDGINTVFKTSERYDANSLEGFKIDANNNSTPITLISLGLDYIQVEGTIIEVGEKLKVTYNAYGSTTINNQSELVGRIVQLEKAVEGLYELNKALKEGLNNRVNVTTFQAWLRLVEKKLGIDIVDKGSNINQELYK